MRLVFSRIGTGTTPNYIAIIAVILIISSAFVLASCGAGGGGATSAERGSGAAKYESGTETTGAITSELGLELTLLSPAGAISPDAIRTTEVANADGTVELVLSADDAPAFSSVNLEIRFDTARFNPVSWAIGAMFDAGSQFPSNFGLFGISNVGAGAEHSEGVVAGAGEYQSLGSPGVIAGGAMYIAAAMRGADHLGVAVARVRPDLNGELSGSGEVARIVFERRAYQALTANNLNADGRNGSRSTSGTAHTARTASAGEYEAARTPQYFWDWDYGVVIPRGSSDNLQCEAVFTTQLPGDADGDLEVTVADITPIATNYLKTLNWYGGKIAYNPEKSTFGSIAELKLPDLDKDAEVGISDITEIVYAYQRKYDWDHIAYRQTGSYWTFSVMGNYYAFRDEIVPVTHHPESEWSLSYPRQTSAPFHSDGFEYGLPYWLPGSDEIHVLPFAEWDFDLFRHDTYISSAGIDPSTGELRLVVDFVGDVDHYDNEVGAPDVSAFANDFPVDLTLESLIPFFSERFRDDFYELYLQTDGDDIECRFSVVLGAIGILLFTDYLLRIEGLSIDYFDSTYSETPFRTEYRPGNVLRMYHGSLIGSYDPNKLNFNTDERFESASTRALRTMPSRFADPVYVSLKLVFSDGTYAVWHERILIE